jgi:hypothetical protein
MTNRVAQRQLAVLARCDEANRKRKLFTTDGVELDLNDPYVSADDVELNAQAAAQIKADRKADDIA